MEKLLVFLPSRINYAIMAFKAIRSLRENHPDIPIDLVADASTAPLYMDTPYIDKLLPFRKDSSSSAEELGLRLAPQKYSTALLLEENPDHLSIARHARIACLMGSEGKNWKRSALHKKSTLCLHNTTNHRSSYFVSLLQDLGLIKTSARTAEPWEPPARSLRAASRVLREHFGHYALICTGPADEPLKCWPAERMADVAKGLRANHQLHIVLTGAAKDEYIGQSITRALGDIPHTNLVAQTDITTLIGLVAGAKIVLGGEAAPIHLADSMHIPLVTVFGPSDSQLWGPISPKAALMQAEGILCTPCNSDTCDKPGHYCMDLVDTDEVYWTCERVMQ